MKHLAVAAIVALAAASCTAAESPASGADRQATSSLREPDVRYDPSPREVVRAMLDLAGVTEKDVVYDLGSGDGRIPIAAARDYGARGVGIEIDPKLVARARTNAEEAGVAERVTFRNEDLFEADFREATVVTLFLLPEVNLRLRPRLLAELRPGTRVISHYHDMGDWEPDRSIKLLGRSVYLWTIPKP